MDNAAAAAVQDFRALVVDDEAPLADVVASYLKRELFEVHLAHDGTVHSPWHVKSIPTSSSLHRTARRRRHRGVPTTPSLLRRLRHHVDRP